jgi:hypothetical protein
MNSIEGITLYIKRAEEHHTKEYIIEAFSKNDIGKVSNTTFIKKKSEQGNTYHGVIVEFERWSMSLNVKKLFDQMNKNDDGISKFHHNKNQFWFIHVYSKKSEEMVVLTKEQDHLSDKDKIKMLEDMVRSLTAQNYYFQLKQEKMENQMMEYERVQTMQSIKNTELSGQMIFSELDKNHYEYMIEELEKNNDELEEENEHLRCKLASNSIKLTNAENENVVLKEDIKDVTAELGYYLNYLKDIEYELNVVEN